MTIALALAAHRAIRRALLPLVLLSVPLLGACSPSEGERLKAAAQRAALERITPDALSLLLRERYATERACLQDIVFPAIVFLDADSADPAATRVPIYMRRFETLRGGGLVTREEVRPGDRDWRVGRAAHIDSGGTKRVVRYVLTARGRASSEALPDAHDDGMEQLCYARRRLLAVDSVVVREPTLRFGQPGVMGAGNEPARYVDGSIHAGHTVAHDSVASWVDDVVRGDSLQDFGELHPRLVAGVQRRWAHFGLDDGGNLRRAYITLERGYR